MCHIIKAYMFLSCARKPSPESTELRLLQDTFVALFECDQFTVDIDVLTSSMMLAGRKSSCLYRCANVKESSFKRKCIHRCMQWCVTSNIRVIKTIRFRMLGVDRLLRLLPDLKVIHLVRDPRGMLLSRIMTGEYCIHDQSRTFLRECGRVLSDRLAFKELSLKYPNRLITEYYEDIAVRPMQALTRVYRYLGLDKPPMNVQTYLQRHTEGGLNKKMVPSVDIVHGWRTKIAMPMAQSIDAQCSELYDELGYIPIKNINDLRNYSVSLRNKDLFIAEHE